MHVRSLLFIFLVILARFRLVRLSNGIVGRELEDGAGVIIVIVLVATAVEDGYCSVAEFIIVWGTG